MRLLGAADAVWERSAHRCRAIRERHDCVLAEAREPLGESRFKAAWEDGKQLPLGATIDLVQPVRQRLEPMRRRG